MKIAHKVRCLEALQSDTQMLANCPQKHNRCPIYKTRNVTLIVKEEEATSPTNKFTNNCMVQRDVT